MSHSRQSLRTLFINLINWLVIHYRCHVTMTLMCLLPVLEASNVNSLSDTGLRQSGGGGCLRTTLKYSYSRSVTGNVYRAADKAYELPSK